jgi:hypothetical protein
LHGEQLGHAVLVGVVFFLEMIVIEVMMVVTVVVFVNALIVATLASFFVENLLDFCTPEEAKTIFSSVTIAFYSTIIEEHKLN